MSSPDTSAASSVTNFLFRKTVLAWRGVLARLAVRWHQSQMDVPEKRRQERWGRACVREHGGRDG